MKTPLAVALLALAASMPALAAKQAYGGSGSFTLAGWKMVDLDPNDGVAPFANLLTDDWGFATDVRFRGGAGAWDSASDIHHNAFTGALYSALDTGGAVGAASLVPATSFLAGQMNVMGAASPGTRFNAFTSSASNTMTWMLAPNTGIQIDGFYSVDAWARRAPNSTGARGSMAYVTFGQSGMGLDSRGVEASARPELGPSFAQLSGALSFLVANRSSANAMAIGSVSVWTSGGQMNPSGSVSPIPEPGTYALMAAGLGIVGAVVRQRKAAH
jgi:hypothetical protein